MSEEHLRLGILTDIHLAPTAAPTASWHNEHRFDRSEVMFDMALTELKSRDVDAIVLLGDTVHFGDEASLDLAARCLAKVHQPTIVVPGNHDGELWLDQMLGHTQMETRPDEHLSGDWLERISAIRNIEFRRDSKSWHIEGPTIAQSAPQIILTHFPFIGVGEKLEAAGLKYAGDAEWDMPLQARPNSPAPVIVLHGHLHVRYELAIGSILQVGFAALIEPPHAAATIDIFYEDDELVVRLEHFDVTCHNVSDVPVLSPAKSRWQFRGDTWLSQSG